MDILIGDLQSIDDADKNSLQKAGYRSVAEVLIPSADMVSKRTRLSSADIERITLAISEELLGAPNTVYESRQLGSERFTTGDEQLDALIGGGIRTGVIWEIAGEAASGKTQLALQLALTSQLPVSSGGLEGSTCYITTHSVLPTQRLAEILEENTLFKPEHTSLSDIHTCNVDIPKALTYYLREGIPTLMESLKAEGRKPIKLVVIDSIAALFRTSSKATTVNLVERSKYLYEISSLLHSLITKHGIAAVVVNEVTSVFETEGSSSGILPNELIYKDQSRWFNRPDDTFWDDKQDAALGLVWTNQINVRLFLSRTGRTTIAPADNADGEERSAKRRRLDASASSSTRSILLRRIDVVFSCFGPARSIDFVLTSAGFKTVSYTSSNGTKSGYFGGVVDVTGALPEAEHVPPVDPTADDEDDMYESGLALDAAASQLDEDEDFAANEALLDPD